MKDAFEPVEGGVLLDVDVKPSADRDAFPDGYNEWRERVDASVRAPARDGEANRALRELVADVLAIDADRVGIRRGRTSRRKTLFLRGVSVEEARARIGA